MLTIFTCPKPFVGHIGIIQRNAINSWKLLHPSVEIILFGDEEGLVEIAKEFNIFHIPNIKKNSYGTPLLDDVFKKAYQIAHNTILCYVNADIIILHDFLEAINQVMTLKNKFLLVGQRWDVELNYLWDFSELNWEQKMRIYISEHAKLHPPAGSDFFVFPKETIINLPELAVGRAGWDNWMIYNANECGVSTINITPITKVIHQNHDYKHVKESVSGDYENPESVKNKGIIKGKIAILSDTTYILKVDGLIKNPHKITNKFERLYMKFRKVIHD